MFVELDKSVDLWIAPLTVNGSLAPISQYEIYFQSRIYNLLPWSITLPSDKCKRNTNVENFQLVVLKTKLCDDILKFDSQTRKIFVELTSVKFTYLIFNYYPWKQASETSH